MISYIILRLLASVLIEWHKPGAWCESVCGGSISKVSGQNNVFSRYTAIAGGGGKAREGDDKRPDCGVITL